MSDILEAATQDMIADSLLTAPIVGDSREGALTESPEPQESQAEQLADLNTDREDWRAEKQEPDEFVKQEAARRNAEQQQGQQQQPEAPQQTPEQIQESIQALDNIVRENSLNDPVAAKDFASGLCEAFGTDVYREGVNVEALGHTMSKVAYSALSIYDSMKGNPQQLPGIPAESARAFTQDFLKAFGVDARTAQVDSQLLAQTVLAGALNFIDSYNRFGGKITDLAQLNQPEAAEWFLDSFLQAFGIQGQVDRATALKFADAGGKYLLSFMGKLGQVQARAPQQRASRRGSSGRQGNRFRTNADIFAPEVLERLDLEKANARNSSEFSPKTRRGSSRFQSNTDIFDDEVMAERDLRIL